MNGDIISTIAILIGVTGLIIFIAREFWCWYFKINDIKKLLEKIEENTRKPEGK